MAGKRQHYLPQLLQRGFISSPRGERTWLHRVNGTPKEVGIRDIGVEDYFYSDAADTELDDSITKVEAEEFGSLIDQLRGGLTPVDCRSHLARVISHLEVRSKNLREGFQDTAQKLWDRTIQALQDPEVLLTIFKNRDESSPGRLLEEARKELQRQGLPPQLAPTIAASTSKLLSNANDEYFRHMWNELLPILKIFLGPALSRSARNAHQAALKKSIAPELRMARYEQFDFQNVEFPGENLILGDSAVFFEVDGKNRFKTFVR